MFQIDDFRPEPHLAVFQLAAFPFDLPEQSLEIRTAGNLQHGMFRGAFPDELHRYRNRQIGFARYAVRLMRSAPVWIAEKRFLLFAQKRNYRPVLRFGQMYIPQHITLLFFRIYAIYPQKTGQQKRKQYGFCIMS